MIRPLFRKYQKQLLFFCNTDNGRDFLKDNFGGKLEKNDIIWKVTPDGFHVLKDFVNDRPIIQATFFPRSPYLKKFAETLTYLSIMEDYQDVRKMDGRKIAELGRHIYLASGDPIYPDPDPETTSVDGNVARTTVNETFATIRSGAGTLAEPSAAFGDIYLEATATTDQYIHLYRNICLFDTSSLPDDATILNTSKISLYGRDVSGTLLGDLNVNVYLSTPASNTNLVAADYAQLGTVAQAANKLCSAFLNAQYNDWDLTATGDGNISLTGITKFGFRFTNDADNTAPTWSSAVRSNIALYNADQAGTSNDPKLVVTYTVPTAGRFLKPMKYW